MLQEGSGQWFVWHNGQWQAASPYPVAPVSATGPVGATGPSLPPSNPNYAASGYAASSGTPTAGSAAYAQAQPGYPQALPPLNGSWGKVFGSMLKAAIAALVIFTLIGLALVAFTDDFELGQMPLVMLAPTALSLIISFFSVSSQWRGQIVQFVTKREREGNDDEMVHYRNVTYARLQPRERPQERRSPSQRLAGGGCDREAAWRVGAKEGDVGGEQGLTRCQRNVTMLPVSLSR